MSTQVDTTKLTPAALLDFSTPASDAGATCAWLTPAINARLKDLASGELLEVRVADASAQEDILSWSRLSGHVMLGMTADSQVLRFYLRKK